jgi:hypothetical protein
LIIRAESIEQEPREWCLWIDGRKTSFRAKSGQELQVDFTPTGKHTVTFQVLSPETYRGFMKLAGKTLAFAVNENMAFQVAVRTLQGTWTKSYDIWSGTQNIPPLASIVETPHVRFMFGWDSSKWNMKSATVTLTADQSANVGADAYAKLNGSDTAELHWGAFDTSEKSATADATSFLKNGANEAWVSYDTHSPSWLGDYAIGVKKFYIIAEFEWVGSGTPPSSGPNIITTPALTTTQMILIGAAAILGIAGIVLITGREKAPAQAAPPIVIAQPPAYPAYYPPPYYPPPAPSTPPAGVR